MARLRSFASLRMTAPFWLGRKQMTRSKRQLVARRKHELITRKSKFVKRESLGLGSSEPTLRVQTTRRMGHPQARRRATWHRRQHGGWRSQDALARADLKIGHYTTETAKAAINRRTPNQEWMWRMRPTSLYMT